MGLFECLPVDAELAGAIAKGVSELELGALLRGKHFKTLLADGAAKVRSGLTTAREVIEAATVV
jgi:type II secretory ATPase GspE/PulE/Tfp pilus assembly ATPase PilB-like protein